MSKELVKRTERGWAGHFCCADRCMFRRNTLLTYNGVEVVVSTVGLMMDIHSPKGLKFEKVGSDRYFETMVFYANPLDIRFHDPDVSQQIYFDSPWCIDEIDADDRANDMHEVVVEEISKKLRLGLRSPYNV